MCINTILQIYSSSCLYFLSDFQTSIHLEGLVVLSYNIQDFQRAVLEHKCETFVICSNRSLWAFELVEQKLRYQNYSVRFNNRKYFIVDPKCDVSDFSKSKYFRHVGEVLVKREIDSSVCNKMFCSSENVSYEIVSMKGRGRSRLLNISTFNYHPYSSPTANIGSEYLLIREYALRQNKTLLAILDDVGKWGKIYSDSNATGVVGFVVNDETEIAFAAIFPWISRYWYTDFSHSVMRTEVICIVPEASKTKGKGKLQHFNGAFLTVTEVFFLQPTSLMFSEKLLKGRILSIFIPIVLLESMYNSLLSSELTLPFFIPPIKTPEDLAEQKITWLGSQADAWIESIQDDDSRVYKQITYQFEVIKSLKFPENVGFAAERLSSGYFAMEDFITEKMLRKLVPMEIGIYYSHTIIVARKNSVLLPSLNKFILLVQQTGLHLYWESYAIIKEDTKRQQALVDTNLIKKARPLLSQHFKGVFWGWFIGLCIATFSFVLERYTKTTKKLKTHRKPAKQKRQIPISLNEPRKK